MIRKDLAERVERYGADVEGAMKRLLNDWELYEKCLWMFVTNPNFETLGYAVKDKDRAWTRDTLYALKGSAANLGLTPVLAALDRMMALLAEGWAEDAAGAYDEILRSRAELRDIL